MSVNTAMKDERLKDGPNDAEHGLLVLHADVPLGEGQHGAAEGPHLSQGREPAGASSRL